jgi:hypothetical protein
MSLATLARPQAASLGELVDGIALRTGAWVVVEQFGAVLAHGAGQASCPPALATALLTKSMAALRTAVRWSRGTAQLRGSLDAVDVVPVDLGAGATVWFVDGPVEQPTLAHLRSAVCDDAPVIDTFVNELLHPRGPLRPSRPPDAVLVVLSSAGPLAVLSRCALAAVAGTDARVHTEPTAVVVALPDGRDIARLIDGVRQRCSDAVAGVARVLDGASDWSAAHRVATAAASAAARLGLTLGDSNKPRIGAELVVDEAQEAARLLADQLESGPLQRLAEHDARNSSDLIATLTAWCVAGFDVKAAAATLHVHANTLRYRLRRAGEISGLDLDRPRHLLALQLLLTT